MLLFILLHHILVDLVIRLPGRLGGGTVADLVALAAELIPFFFLPLPLWILTALLARTRSGLIAAAVPWVLFAWLYGGLFIPRSMRVADVGAQPPPTIRVLTFNLLNTNRSADQIAALVKTVEPDVICVQELESDLARALDARLAATYPNKWLVPDGAGAGAGIWSRHRLLSQEAWDPSAVTDRWQHVTLRKDGSLFHVVNLHLNSPSPTMRRRARIPVPIVTGIDPNQRRAEVAYLEPRLRALVARLEPAIVVGDLNLTDQTPEYRDLIAAGLIDAHRTAGWGFGFTFPATPLTRVLGRPFPPRPFVRIDYVLHSSELRALNVQVWPTAPGSDHHPVIADLALTD